MASMFRGSNWYVRKIECRERRGINMAEEPLQVRLTFEGSPKPASRPLDGATWAWDHGSYDSLVYETAKQEAAGFRLVSMTRVADSSPASYCALWRKS